VYTENKYTQRNIRDIIRVFNPKRDQDRDLEWQDVFHGLTDC